MLGFQTLYSGRKQVDKLIFCVTKLAELFPFELVKDIREVSQPCFLFLLKIMGKDFYL